MPFGAMAPACLCPWQHYKTLLDTAVKVTIWGFWAKIQPEGLTLDFVTHTLLCFVTQNFLILFYMIRSMICNPIRDPVLEQIWSDPVESRFHRSTEISKLSSFKLRSSQS